MNLKKALCVYNTVFWVLLIIMLALQVTVGLGAVLNFYVYAPLTFVFSIVTTFCILPPEPPLNQEADEEVHKEEPLEAPPRKTERIVWIDQLKVLLICLVVLGHSAVTFMGFGAFISLDKVVPSSQEGAEATPYYDAIFWSGFLLLKPTIVPLFFFISGYFSAAGRIKHGRGAFLRKSFWRLGPVAIIFWLLFNPLNAFLGYILVKPEDTTYMYSPGQAATWFLTWLMVFNSCYALIDDEEFTTPIEKPTFGRIIKFGLTLAILQAVAGVLCLFSGGAFAEMPCLFVGDGYFNAVGYASGILAKTHGWLKNEPEPENEPLVKKATIYVVLASIVTISISFLCFVLGPPLDKAGGENEGEGFLFLCLILFLPLGPYCPFAWIVWLNKFQRKQVANNNDCEVASERRKDCWIKALLSGAAFTVFLIHYYFITIYTWLYIKILEEMKAESEEIVLTDLGKLSGFAFVAVLSLVSSFLAGIMIKKIPGVGKFL